MAACGQASTHWLHWMQIRFSHTGTSAARLRFSHLLVPTGQVPSTGNALTGSRSPLPASIIAVTRCTKGGASRGTAGGRGAPSALRAEVAKVAQGGVTEAELNRVKTQWVANQVYRLDSLMNQAQELGSQWVMGMPVDAQERLIERLRGVTAAQVQAVAAKYFGDDQLTVGILRPQPIDPNKKPRQRPAGVRD